MAVGGVGIEGSVRDDAERGAGRLDRGDGARNEAVRVDGLAPVGRLLVGVDVWKERDGRNAEARGSTCFLDQEIDAQAVGAGHGCDALAASIAIDDEHRVDQIVHRERVFAYQPAREIVGAIAPHAGHREAHGGNSTKRPLAWNKRQRERTRPLALVPCAVGVALGRRRTRRTASAKRRAGYGALPWRLPLAICAATHLTYAFVSWR